MRKSLATCLLLVAVMLVGCQTQSWRGTEYEPGAGRDAEIPWNVHSGLFELNLAAGGGFLAIKNEPFASDPAVETFWDLDSMTPLGFDFDAMTLRGQAFLGYMINDFWELGLFVECAQEKWDPEDLDEFDVTGWAIGPRLVYNFSTVGTDVVPYVALSGGMGSVTYEDLAEIGDYDADRCFGQLGLGIRFFGWEQVALNLEGYYRYVSDAIDDTVDGTTIDTTVNGNEGGVLVSLSLFF